MCTEEKEKIDPVKYKLAKIVIAAARLVQAQLPEGKTIKFVCYDERGLNRAAYYERNKEHENHSV